MTDSLDPSAVWREFCSRIAEAGAAVLDDPAAAGARNRHELSRWAAAPPHLVGRGRQ